jgi:hypothetical protein
MLILTRRANESVVIGSVVEVQALGIRHGRVKLAGRPAGGSSSSSLTGCQALKTAVGPDRNQK